MVTGALRRHQRLSGQRFTEQDDVGLQGVATQRAHGHAAFINERMNELIAGKNLIAAHARRRINIAVQFDHIGQARPLV